MQDESPYQESEDVEELASTVMSRFPDMPAATEGARIKFLTKTQEKSSWAGKCYRTTGPWNFLLPDFDFVVLIWLEWWETHNEQERQALLYHELLHINQTKHGSWRLRQHDIQEFSEVITSFGAWNDQLLALSAMVGVRKEG
jgi:hypothetical protein